MKKKKVQTVKQLENAQILTSNEVSRTLEVDTKTGLTTAQVANNQTKYGENKILGRKKQN